MAQANLWKWLWVFRWLILVTVWANFRAKSTLLCWVHYACFTRPISLGAYRQSTNMATIKDVARVSGVSVATVSRVINHDRKVAAKTRLRVQQAIDELGYRLNANARDLVAKKQSTVGVVIPDLTDPFFAALANGVERVARQHHMQLLLSTGLQSEPTEKKAIELLLQRRCDSIVVHSKKINDKDLIELVKDNRGIVLIDRFIPSIRHSCIWLDNFAGGKMAARHFLDLNHRAFACIMSAYEIDDPKLRLSGFVESLCDAGELLAESSIVYAEPSHRGGELAVNELLAGGAYFTALFVYNDAMALGAISALVDRGIDIPSDVSVVGFDDVLFSRFSRPKLTTLSYPINEMAEQAAELAIRNAGRSTLDCKPLDSEEINFKHQPTLVLRDSTASR